MKTIKELFEIFWKKEWNKLEGEINQFAFKFYKEGYEQNKKDILGLIVISYKKCNKCLIEAERNKRFINHIENFKGRLDELTLLYSDIKGCNFNEAKEELKKRIEGK